MPPLVAPAPTMVWISSMNRIAPRVVLERLHHGLEALLEVAAVPRAREQRAHVERVDRGVLAATSGTSPSTIAQREALGDRGLADARLADESGLFLRRRHSTWIVRSSSRLAADQRIDAAALGLLVEVDAVGRERVQRLLLASSPSRALCVLVDAAHVPGLGHAGPLGDAVAMM